MEEVKLLKIDGGYVYAPEQYWHFEECEPETCYVFKEEELDEHGKLYLNMLRIIKDRSLQQVSKSEADEHGYKFIRSRRRKYLRGNNSMKMWLVTKQTPYSVKMPISVVERSVMTDLETYYNSIIRIKGYKSTVYSGGTPVKDMFSLLSFLNVRHEEPPDSYKPLIELFESKGIDYQKPRVIIELSELSANYAVGVYEVTYWATEII